MSGPFVYVSHLLNAHDRRFLEAIASNFGDVHVLTFRPTGIPSWLGTFRGVTVHNLERRGMAYDDPDEERYPSRWERFRLHANLKFYEWEVRRWILRLRPAIVQGMWVPTDGFVAARSGFHPLVIAPFVTDIIKKTLVSERLLQKVGWTLDQADRIMVDCQWVRDKIIDLYPHVEAQRIVVFPRGVEIDQYIAPTKELRNSRPVIFCCRAFEPVYDHETLFASLDFCQHLDFELWLAGAGSLETKLRADISGRAWKDRVQFLGQLNSTQIAERLKRSDLYLSAARQDGVSVSLLEAMASGLPCVVTDLPTNREWITPGIHGALFEPGQPQKLAECLTILLPDQTTRRQMGLASRAKAEKDANWVQHRETMLNVYRDLLSASTNSR